VPSVPVQDAAACAEFASPAAAAVVITWPDPMAPFPKPTASALAPGADAWLSAR
jgi:sugar/nucleoside kinase (ribokinase family)